MHHYALRLRTDVGFHYGFNVPGKLVLNPRILSYGVQACSGMARESWSFQFWSGSTPAMFLQIMPEMVVDDVGRSRRRSPL
jgi:hypothetical protein